MRIEGSQERTKPQATNWKEKIKQLIFNNKYCF